MSEHVKNALILCHAAVSTVHRILNTPREYFHLYSRKLLKNLVVLHITSRALLVSKRLLTRSRFAVLSPMFTRSVAMLFILVLAVPVSAASIGDSFTINALIGDDSTPPSIPSPVAATPMATTQIDVTWGPSTDDTSVAGYQLFRDSVQIATTTLTSYSDTGLVASTTYTYTVVAFDIFSNFSSSSAPVSTTTFALPPPTPAATSSSSGGQATRIDEARLRAFSVVPGTESAVFSFETSLPVRFTLRYGEGNHFSDGIVEGGVFSGRHETLVSGLKAGTTYEFELIVTDRFGRSSVLKQGAFTTLASPDTYGPENVANFTARASGLDVLLSWDEPRYSDFSHVRIVRNHLFFPGDTNDGIVVYEGRSSEFVDKAALTEHGIQYYSIFAYDASGQRSSGAIAVVRRAGATGPTPGQVPPASSTTPPVTITLSDIEVVQDGEVMRLAEPDFQLRNDAPFTLRVPYALFPKHLKVITVTLALPSDPNRVFSFLLRATEDFSYYEAALAPLAEGGEYGFSFSIFDVKTNHIFELSGRLPVSDDTGDAAPGGQSEAAAQSRFWLLLLFILGCALFLYGILTRRRDEDNGAVGKP